MNDDTMSTPTCPECGAAMEVRGRRNPCPYVPGPVDMSSWVPWYACPHCEPIQMMPFAAQATMFADRVDELTRQLAERDALIKRMTHREPVSGCHKCKTTIWSNESEIVDADGKHYHQICLVTQRAEIAEARIERLERQLLGL